MPKKKSKLKVQASDSSDSDDLSNFTNIFRQTVKQQDYSINQQKAEDEVSSSASTEEDSSELDSDQEKVKLNKEKELDPVRDDDLSSATDDDLSSATDDDLSSVVEENKEDDHSDDGEHSPRKLDDDADLINSLKDDNTDGDTLPQQIEPTASENIDNEYVKIREELKDLSFEQLQKLKEKIGIKAYKEIMFGSSKSKISKTNAFKRANKNRPMEISSKKPVSKFRDVVQVKKKTYRDPRFDDLSGKYDERLFNQSYGFLSDMKQKEKKLLIEQYKKERKPEKKKQIEQLIKRWNQQEKLEQERAQKEQKMKEMRKKETALVKQGKKPYFLKKSDQKRLDLAERYKELKKSGKVENFLAKKRKKTASKDRKHLPQNL